MDRQRIEGGVKKATGTIKEKAGQVIGDRHLEGEGKAENAGAGDHGGARSEAASRSERRKGCPLSVNVA